MFVQPSSLIFLVIIGIWAAYFVQYWVRRREHLATIRSVDAFSETMRVLERRAPLPSLDHGGQAPRTYAVSPARAMRPQVTVKRAEAHIAPPVVEVEAQAEGNDMAQPVHTTMRPGRAARGIVVLVGLVGTIVFGVLAALGILMSWSFVVPLAMAGGGFAWLRSGVQSEIKSQRAARGRARRAAARATSPVSASSPRGSSSVAARPAQQQPADVVASAPAAESVVEIVAASVPFDGAGEVVASVSQAPAPDLSTPESVPFDVPVEVQPVATQQVAPLPELDEDDIPLTWDPRPVPRPTYTMKARAPERPAPTAEVPQAAEAEQPAYDDVMERRTGSF